MPDPVAPAPFRNRLDGVPAAPEPPYNAPGREDVAASTWPQVAQGRRDP